WDGIDWSARATAVQPGARYGHVLAFDPVREETLVYGGSGQTMVGPVIQPRQHSDTFLYGPENPATVIAFRSACRGGGGGPVLAPPGTSRPWLGATLQLAVAHLPASGPVIAILGQSNRTWSGGPLPFALASLGMPGCSLLVSTDAAVAVVNVNGTA